MGKGDKWGKKSKQSWVHRETGEKGTEMRKKGSEKLCQYNREDQGHT